MKSGRHCLLALMFPCLGFSAPALDAQDSVMVDSVLRRICEAVHLAPELRPELGYFEASASGAWAYYVWQSQTIKINRQLFQHLDSWPRHAKEVPLAILIGHELTHHIQHTNCKGEAYLIPQVTQLETNYQRELDADFRGIFSAYLAQYRLDLYLEASLNLLLSEAPDNSYPPPHIRHEQAARFFRKADTMLTMYQIGLSLMETRHFELASQCFQQVYEVFHGREICNQIAIAYMHLALEHLPDQFQELAYPFETDPDIRLQFEIRQPPPRNPQLGSQYLDLAERFLSLAKQEDPSYPPTVVNSACLAFMRQARDGRPFFLSQWATRLTRQGQTADYLACLQQVVNAAPAEKIRILDQELMKPDLEDHIQSLLRQTRSLISGHDAPPPFQLPRNWTLSGVDRHYLRRTEDGRPWFEAGELVIHQLSFQDSDLYLFPGKQVIVQLPAFADPDFAPPLSVLELFSPFEAHDALEELGPCTHIRKTAAGFFYWYQESGLLIWTDHHHAMIRWCLVHIRP